VVAGSTPVLFFGNPQARIATISLNPSYNEFLHDDGALLPDNERRLATLPSLGIQRYDEINDQIAAKIVDECAEYFQNRPYMRWFRPLNCILHDGLGVSYCDGTACHLDLAQWATSPTWNGLRDNIQQELLNDGRPFLLQQLRQENYRLVLVNGREVINAIERARLTTWNRVGGLNDPSTDLYVGESGATRFLAWSCNIQSQPGARRHIPALKTFVSEYSNLDPPGGNDTLP